jgi:hypothetical protein
MREKMIALVAEILQRKIGCLKVPFNSNHSFRKSSQHAKKITSRLDYSQNHRAANAAAY